MSSGAKKTVAKKPVAKAPAAAATKKKSSEGRWHSEHAHLFSKNTKNFGVGKHLPPKRDLGRFVKWPRYVRIQRQRSILKKRLKVPPAINQFSRTLDKNQASNVFRLLAHYRPETKTDKAKRLKEQAAAEVKGNAAVVKGDKPVVLKYGLNHITSLVETKKAKLVVIAHDVDPIELVVWLPALCRKMNVPYCIVKSKSRLGHLVHKKTASVVALTEVRKEDVAKLEQLVQNVRVQYNDNATDRKKWGGGVMGTKAQAVIRAREAARLREAAQKA